MNREMGLFEALASDGAYQCLRDHPRGAIGRIFAPHTSHEGGAVKARPYRCRRHLDKKPIGSSANIPETSSVASPIGLPLPHWSSGRAAAPFPFH